MVDIVDSIHCRVDSRDGMVDSGHSPDSGDSSHSGVDSGDSMVDSGDSSHRGLDSGDHRVGGHYTSMVAVDSSMVAVDLSDGVGLSISISISLTLAIVSMDSIDSMVGHLGVATNSGVDSR